MPKIWDQLIQAPKIALNFDRINEVDKNPCFTKAHEISGPDRAIQYLTPWFHTGYETSGELYYKSLLENNLVA